MSDKEFVTKEQCDNTTDIITTAINGTNKRIDDLKDYISWGIAIISISFIMVQIGIGFLLYILTK